MMERLFRALTEDELLYLEQLIPADDKAHAELKVLLVTAWFWRYQRNRKNRGK